MIPTLATLRTRVQELLLGDPAITTTIIDPFLAARNRDLFAALNANGLPAVERFGYFNLPAFTSVLKSSAMGITDMGEITEVEERAIIASVALSTTDVASPIGITTATPHLASTNERIVIYGVTGQTGANGEWYFTSTGGSTGTLNGSQSEGAYVSGGVFTRASDKFQPMEPVDDLPEFTPGPFLRQYEWSGEALLFVPATQVIQLKVTYNASGNGTTYIDDSLDILAYGAAGDIAPLYGLTTEGQKYLAQAEQSKQRLVRTMVRAEQDIPSLTPPFRDRRIGWERRTY